MNEVIVCPIDAQPCDDCPDRFYNRPEGGCLMTMLLEHSGAVFNRVPSPAEDHNSKNQKEK